MTNRIAILGALAVIAGCTGDDAKPESGDTAGPTTTMTGTGQCDEIYEGATIIQVAQVSCLDDNTVRFYVETDGWTGDGVVFSQETANAEPQYADEHDLNSYEFDPCGFWDHLEQELTTGAAFGKSVTNESTVFRCDTDGGGAGYHHNADVMSYAAAVYDIDGAFADCLAWGHDPQGLIDNAYNRTDDPSFAANIGDCVIGVSAR